MSTGPTGEPVLIGEEKAASHSGLAVGSSVSISGVGVGAGVGVLVGVGVGVRVGVALGRASTTVSMTAMAVANCCGEVGVGVGLGLQAAVTALRAKTAKIKACPRTAEGFFCGLFGAFCAIKSIFVLPTCHIGYSTSSVIELQCQGVWCVVHHVNHVHAATASTVPTGGGRLEK